MNLGNGDQVRCFHCDGGLRLWDPSDDPWMEHARWFNTCGYVTLVKGEQFVKQAIVQHSPSSFSQTVNSIIRKKNVRGNKCLTLRSPRFQMLDSSLPSTPQRRPQPHKHPVTDRDLQTLMTSESVVVSFDH